MGKLPVRIGVAVLLAALLLWAARAQGSLATEVRALAKGYIRSDIIRVGRAQGREAAASAQQARLHWPLAGTVAPGPADGIRIEAPTGALVRAAASGKVESVESDPPGVAITIAGGALTLRYGHIGPSYVVRGQVVRARQVIGEIPHFGPQATPGITLEALRGGKAEALPGPLGAP